MSQPNKIARISIALTFLDQLLPAGTEILDINIHKVFGSAELVVSHPSFKELRDGECIPERTVMIHGHWCEECKSRHPSKKEYDHAS